jgi:aerotaxis receptor
MRINEPVTQQEYPVRDDVVIVSHTDKKGKICE